MAGLASRRGAAARVKLKRAAQPPPRARDPGTYGSRGSSGSRGGAPAAEGTQQTAVDSKSLPRATARLRLGS